MTTFHADNQRFPVALPGAKADTLMWADPTEVEFAALDQLRAIAALPWTQMLRVMPDVHLGKGATVGSVIAMRDAVAPNAVGVDIGCGMIAVKSSLRCEDLPDSLSHLRAAIELAIPVGPRGYEDQAPTLRGNRELTKQFTTLFRAFDAWNRGRFHVSPCQRDNEEKERLFCWLSAAGGECDRVELSPRP